MSLASRVAVTAFLILAAAFTSSAGESDWVLSCNGISRWFPANADLAFLQKEFGQENVQVGEVDSGEGMMEPGAIIFPNDPQHRVEVLWKDTKLKAGIDQVTVAGDHTAWHACESVTIGTDLKHLEELNGRPFFLAGLGWDYSGGVSDWRGGKLAQELKNVWMLMEGNAAREIYDQVAVAGDKQFLSNYPAMQQVNPAIYKIGLHYPKPSEVVKKSRRKW